MRAAPYRADAVKSRTTPVTLTTTTDKQQAGRRKTHLGFSYGEWLLCSVISVSEERF